MSYELEVVGNDVSFDTADIPMCESITPRLPPKWQTKKFTNLYYRQNTSNQKITLNKHTLLAFRFHAFQGVKVLILGSYKKIGIVGKIHQICTLIYNKNTQNSMVFFIADLPRSKSSSSRLSPNLKD